MIHRLNAALEGRYRIERELGAGGMATVYLARDLKHDRAVAIKVLRPELAAVVGAERFLAEIRTTANLEDPHILPLYDSGEADSFLFYVMPYVEGDTLRNRLDREGQLPVAEALDIVRKIAGALQFAHDQGIVHRDIKPANILLRRGEPMVADFGIALALTQAGGGRITETGLSVGTPHYMSPEQAAGERALDPRSDVYALGCILYEMLTGETPHPGPNAQAVLARVLTDTPRRVSALRRTVPAHVEAVAAKALEKLPADRFGSARELAEALDDERFRHDPSASAAQSSSKPTLHLRSARPALAAAFLAGLVVAAVAFRALAREKPSAPAPLLRFAVELPADQGISSPQVGSPVALSPDGRLMVYTGSSSASAWQLWLRPTSGLRATPIPGSQNGLTPVFSPDGSRLAFIGPDRGLRVVEMGSGSSRVLGGRVVSLLDWSPGGWIYFHAGQTFGDIRRIHVDGGGVDSLPVISGAPRPVPEWGQGSTLPGDRGMVLTRFSGAGTSLNAAEIVVVDFEDGTVTPLAQGSAPTFVPPDRLLWAGPDGSLLTARFDPDAGVLDGPTEALADNVVTDANATMQYAVSESGSLVYRVGSVAGSIGSLVWVDREGIRSPASDLDVTLTVGLWDAIDLSPDGRRVALSLADGPNSQVWAVDLEGGSPPRRISYDGTLNVRPRWTAGGDSITYITNAAGETTPTQFWIRAADGSGTPSPVVVQEREVEEGMLSPDGEWVAFRVGGTASGRDIFARRRGEDEDRPLFSTDADERAFTLSPDGRWIAYVSNETGRDEIFVTPFPDVRAGKWQISSGGGAAPAWSPAGSELFFAGTGGEVVAVRFTTDRGSFVVSSSTPLFPIGGLLVGPNQTTYTVAPDGDRFLMISIGGEGRELVWVQNWTTGLGG
ncbi:MAG: protein kinase [Longimicrobiales bacterium]|nr:protein kinase [Longimicrobiales bacterium]